MQELAAEKKVLTVSQLNRSVKRMLETSFQTVWIEGEISNLTRPASGHLYFSLKDEQAQVRCAMFRTRNTIMRVAIENGMHVLVCAKITLYEGRGDYQLIVEHVEEQGEGLLRKRFELLKQKLAAEGLFDASNKKKIPSFPKRIGVVTSATGAAIRDVLSILRRRFASIPVIIYPTLVQGELAAKSIARAITIANERKECDVLIICRGGGSLEDLWAFNEEVVAKAIHASLLPTVSGVGHEVDVTITDFVADQRAATPSAAAELVSPDKLELQQRIEHYAQRLTHLTLADFRHRNMLIASIEKQLVRPESILQQYQQSIDLLQQSIIRAMHHVVEKNLQAVELNSLKLKHLNPLQKLREQKKYLLVHYKTLNQLWTQKIGFAKQNLVSASKMLQAVSPLNTLERGYSITTKNNHIIENISTVKPGDHIKVEVRTGYIACDVVAVSDKPEAI